MLSDDPEKFATAPSGGDAEQLPFDNGAFDGAAELGRVCRSGGHLVRRVISTFGVMFATDSLETLLGFDEVAYLALFLWLAVAGPGLISADRLLQGLHLHRGSGKRIT